MKLDNNFNLRILVVYQITWHNNQEHHDPYFNRCENLKSHTFNLVTSCLLYRSW
jgi:hypothetical protein